METAVHRTAKTEHEVREQRNNVVNTHNNSTSIALGSQAPRKRLHWQKDDKVGGKNGQWHYDNNKSSLSGVRLRASEYDGRGQTALGNSKGD